ncbi:MAG: hypothetical protein H6623_07010 [Bdellovibrionaceae bacterium]|nr:hypothetical protein [Pseudobdellovibrionaceae bacterium]
MKNFIVSLAFLLFIFACSTQKNANNNGRGWYNNMHRLSADLSSLTPVLYAQEKYYNPNNLDFLKDKVADMADGASEILHDTTAPKDPIIAFAAQQLEQDLRTSSAFVKVGNLQPARTILSQVGNYCISCHTRSDRGTQNFSSLTAPELEGLNSWQKSQFHLVNRQYQTAYNEIFQTFSQKKNASYDFHGWLSTVYKNLAVIIRVREDLKQAQTFIEALLNDTSLPYYIRHDAGAWLKSIKAWRTESSVKNNAAKVNLAEVKKLIAQAKKEPYTQRQSGLIIYLRASGILHQLLEKTSSSSYPETLYYAGIVAEALKKIDLWRLGEHYFETCIHTTPHTLLAEQCYAQMEWAIQQENPLSYMNPDYAQVLVKKMEDLKALATIVNEPDSMRRKHDMKMFDSK